MISDTKLALFAAVFLGLSYIGWNIYRYNMDSELTVKIVGIEPEGYYKGEITGVIKCHDTYKLIGFELFLDGMPLRMIGRSLKKSFDYPFQINMNELTQGAHKIYIEVIGHSKEFIRTLTFYVDNLPLKASFLKNKVDTQVLQGKTLHVQFQANKELKQAVVKTLSKEYQCFLRSPQSESTFIYECSVPIDTEEVPKENLLTVEIIDRPGNKMALESTFKVVSNTL